MPLPVRSFICDSARKKKIHILSAHHVHVHSQLSLSLSLSLFFFFGSLWAPRPPGPLSHCGDVGGAPGISASKTLQKRPQILVPSILLQLCLLCWKILKLKILKKIACLILSVRHHIYFGIPFWWCLITTIYIHHSRKEGKYSGTPVVARKKKRHQFCCTCGSFCYMGKEIQKLVIRAIFTISKALLFATSAGGAFWKASPSISNLPPTLCGSSSLIIYTFHHTFSSGVFATRFLFATVFNFISARTLNGNKLSKLSPPPPPPPPPPLLPPSASSISSPGRCTTAA